MAVDVADLRDPRPGRRRHHAGSRSSTTRSPQPNNACGCSTCRTCKLLLVERVAHGRGSGDNPTTRFSNLPGSHQSSLGLFRTSETYVGHNGYSLRLEGLEPGFNDRAP